MKAKTKKELILLTDGFNGILALMIYNFSLYLSHIAGIGGIMGEMEEVTGYFGLNSFTSLGFNTSFTIFGVVFMFVFSAWLGITVGEIVRKRQKYRN